MAALLNSLVVVNTKNRHLVWKLRTKLDSVIKTASIIREQAIYRKPNVFSLVSRLGPLKSGFAWSLYKCAALWRTTYGSSATERPLGTIRKYIYMFIDCIISGTKAYLIGLQN